MEQCTSDTIPHSNNYDTLLKEIRKWRAREPVLGSQWRPTNPVAPANKGQPVAPAVSLAGGRKGPAGKGEDPNLGQTLGQQSLWQPFPKKECNLGKDFIAFWLKDLVGKDLVGKDFHRVGPLLLNEANQSAIAVPEPEPPPNHPNKSDDDSSSSADEAYGDIHSVQQLKAALLQPFKFQ
jgi:hypothetical protein